MLPRQDNYLIDKIAVPFFNYNQLVSDPIHAQIKPSVLDTIDSNAITVIDLSTDPIHVDSIRQRLGALDKKIVYLTGDYSQAKNNVLFLPTLMLYRSLEYQNYKYTDSLHKPYAASCLNRIPREHKFYTYAKLLEKSYPIILSFNGIQDSNSKQTISYNDPWYFNLPTDLKEKLKNVPLYKESWPGDNQWANDLTPLHPAFTDCYLNIVTETNSRSAFYSEKICKPLASCQFFLMSSGANSLQGLRSLGIDCFDDVFDHHRYEQLDDFVDRIDAMIALLDQVCPGLEQLYRDNFARLKQNQQYFLSDGFRQKLLAPLKELGLLDK